MKHCFFFFMLCFLLITSCKKSTESSTSSAHLGEIDIDVSVSSEARPHFEEGLLLLHSFQYKDAAENFRKVQNLDPGFTLGYWGEAMSHNHPLWREKDKTKALEILEKLAPTREERMALARSEFEKDMYKGIEILYGEGEKNETDIAYKNHMEELYKKYPENHEIGAQYALSVLGAVKEGRDKEAYEMGAKIAQGIINENPNHPGALHYLIHSYDDPDNAPKALDAAHRYSKVAPDANHALHMPSHIYIALGMWDDVIKSNNAAFKASQKRKEKKDLDNDALDYHSLKWLMYGHLQKNNKEKAKELLLDMKTYCDTLPSKKAAAHLVMMEAAYLSDTGLWNDTLTNHSLDFDNLAIQIKAVWHFTNTLKAFNNKDLQRIENQSTQLQVAINEAKKIVYAGGSQMCSGNYNRSMPTQTHIERATVMKFEIDALAALLKGEDDKFENLITQAIALENETSFMFGPPEIVKPSSELYAEWLIKQSRKEDAQLHFNKVLDRAPKRLTALNGLQEASLNS